MLLVRHRRPIQSCRVILATWSPRFRKFQISTRFGLFLVENQHRNLSSSLSSHRSNHLERSKARMYRGLICDCFNEISILSIFPISACQSSARRGNLEFDVDVASDTHMARAYNRSPDCFSSQMPFVVYRIGWSGRYEVKLSNQSRRP
jgi:hypothetical protein